MRVEQRAGLGATVYAEPPVYDVYDGQAYLGHVRLKHECKGVTGRTAVWGCSDGLDDFVATRAIDLVYSGSRRRPTWVLES